MKFAEFDQYSENMLMAQYDISEIISHELMKGEIREDFLITTLESCAEPKPYLVKGTLSDGENDAGQLDIILCRPYSHVRKLGNQCFVSKDDALCVIEVKGNCTGTDLKKSGAKAETIRNLQSETTPLYGLICYKVALELRTIMNRFGYSFDGANKTYFDRATIPNEVETNWQEIEYPGLDFFVSLEDGKKLFLAKYKLPSGQDRFVRRLGSPLIQEVFSMMRALWIPAHQTPAPVYNSAVEANSDHMNLAVHRSFIKCQVHRSRQQGEAVVGIDVGGERKGFHAVALQNAAFEKLTSINPAAIVDWCLARDAKIIAVDAPCGWSQSASSWMAERALKLAGKKIHCFATPTRALALAHTNDFYDWVFRAEQLYQLLAPHYPLFNGTIRKEPICFETFPHAIVCALAGRVVAAKPKLSNRRQVLEKRGYDVSDLTNLDFIDAALCAVTAEEFRIGRTEHVGGQEEGFIVLPALDIWDSDQSLRAP